MASDSLRIDLADRDDVRAKLPEARAILARKERRLSEYQDEVDFWRGHVDYLTRVAGLAPQPEPEEADEQPADGGYDSPLELVVEVVNREPRKIRSRDVAETLRREGHSVSNTSVSNALYYAASSRGGNRIRKIVRGWYAPLGFQAPSESREADRSADGAADSGLNLLAQREANLQAAAGTSGDGP